LNGKKAVPNDFARWLDPLSLAVWFMDDGGRGAHTRKGLVINTSCFSPQEQTLLQSVLAGKFKIDVSVHNVGKGFQLYVKASSFDRFVGLISPYLIAQMRYKLPVDPVTTSPQWRRDSSRCW
jgi:hypothetical protein